MILGKSLNVPFNGPFVMRVAIQGYVQNAVTSELNGKVGQTGLSFQSYWSAYSNIMIALNLPQRFKRGIKEFIRNNKINGRK